MPFKMNCPHCKKTLNVNESLVGKTVPCPGCSQPIEVVQPTKPSPQAGKGDGPPVPSDTLQDRHLKRDPSPALPTWASAIPNSERADMPQGDPWSSHAGMAAQEEILPAGVQQEALPKSGSRYALGTMSRYTDGYRLARFIVGVGSTVKIIGIVAGAMNGLLCLGIVGGVAGPFPGLMSALLGGGLIYLFFWVIGVLFAAQGQLLRANLDLSVNTSPFLTDDQRAQIMSLG